jgi:hypothetical protein
MKILWDKPYKVGLYFMTILLIGTTTFKSDYNFTNKSKINEPIAVVEDKVIMVQPTPEEILPRVEKKRDIPLSRGGYPIKQSTKRELIDSYVRDIASKYNFEPELIMSVIVQESDYNPKCKTGNCLGLMQVSAIWHKDRADKLGVKDFYDPYGNILLGVDYLSELRDKYKDIRLVLMLYNMEHKTALRMFNRGQISSYAKTVLTRAEQLKKGE